MIKLGDDQTVEYIEVIEVEEEVGEVVKPSTRRIKRPKDSKPEKKVYSRKLPHKDSLTNIKKRKYKVKLQSIKASDQSYS